MAQLLNRQLLAPIHLALNLNLKGLIMSQESLISDIIKEASPSDLKLNVPKDKSPSTVPVALNNKAVKKDNFRTVVAISVLILVILIGISIVSYLKTK